MRYRLIIAPSSADPFILDEDNLKRTLRNWEIKYRSGREAIILLQREILMNGVSYWTDIDLEGEFYNSLLDESDDAASLARWNKNLTEMETLIKQIKDLLK